MTRLRKLMRSPLYDVHVRSGAKMGEFSGWEAPLWYSSVKAEHNVVRQDAGLFDISHMTRIWIEGEGAADFLQRIVSVDVKKIKAGRMKYCLICNENGGIKDDVTLFSIDDKSFLLTCNAITRKKILEWLASHSSIYEVKLQDITEQVAMLALQGPKAARYLEKVAGESFQEMKWFSGRFAAIADIRVLVTRSGYTGEDGFEVFLWEKQRAKLDEAWNSFIKLGVVPCGLGARDALRLECTYPLYGMDENEDTVPVETRLMKAVDMEKGPFIGRDAIAEREKRGATRLLVGLRMVEPSIPRRGYKVYGSDGASVGEVTSGNISYTLGAGIALAYVEAGHASEKKALSIDVRGKNKLAEVTLKSFIGKP